MLSESRVEATVPTKDLRAARSFYEGELDLSPSGAYTDGADVFYDCGQGTRLLLSEERDTIPKAHTVAHFIVDDVEATVRDLRERGVVFEQYDLPGLRTVDGVAAVGDRSFAWFKDPENNVLGIHD
jgi:predicted enzyme related to lactoylglutathione lyase